MEWLRHAPLETTAATVGTLAATPAPALRLKHLLGVIERNVEHRERVGALNLAVSFVLAFRVALRSRGIRLADRSRIHRAIRARLWQRPLSFLLPPRAASAPSV